LSLPFPGEFIILAMEIQKSYTFREGLSEPVQKALPEFIKRAEKILSTWNQSGGSSA